MVRTHLRAGILAALLTGCSAPYIQPTVDLPERPVLPAIMPDELSCLAPSVYADLVHRQTALRDYAEQLELVVRQLVAQ